MSSCDAVSAVAAMCLGILLFNVALVFMVSTIRQELADLRKKWKEVMG